MTDSRASPAISVGNRADSDNWPTQKQKVPPPHPDLLPAIDAANAKSAALAEKLTRDFLTAHPADVAALKLLGDLLMQKNTFAGAQAAEKLFTECLELSPDFTEARHSYAKLLLKMAKLASAKPQLEILLQSNPQNARFQKLMAYMLGQIGDYDDAFKYHEMALAQIPHEPSAWIVYANDLRAAGRTEDSIAGYRHALEIDPGFSGAYWALGDLRTFRFSPADVDQIQAQLKRTDLSVANCVYLNFALGKSFEDEGKYENAFSHFQTANALQRSILPYDAERTVRQFAWLKKIFTPAFFAERASDGCQATDPIFIVGLPRSGSTLVEQILASHSEVEGTRELPCLQTMTAQLQNDFNQKLAELKGEALTRLGEQYLEETKVFRRLGRPRFTDKMLRNFEHVGLIHAILPNAKIVDVRRNPLDCCLANFKQLFGSAYAYSYDLTDLGKYYNAYVDLMAHYDAMLPGRIHRVSYENLVEEPTTEIRKLLDYLGLPFEEQCLRFYESGRAVRTASSEQVRLPIFKNSLGGWQKYERWIAPLKKELGIA